MEPSDEFCLDESPDTPEAHGVDRLHRLPESAEIEGGGGGQSGGDSDVPASVGTDVAKERVYYYLRII